MNLITRLTTSVSATLESAVGALETDDVIAEAKIKQVRQSAAETQARLATLHQQKTAFETQFKLVTEQITVWEQRATSLSNDSKHKALQCLTRRNQHEAEARRLRQSMEQQSSLINTVTGNLYALKSQLDEMTQRHNSMRSGQAVADIKQAVADTKRVVVSDGRAHSLDDTLKHLEAAVLETELAMSNCNDPLETQLAPSESHNLLQKLNGLEKGPGY